MSQIDPTLGDWLDKITDGALQMEPRIGEAQFVHDVLPILESPFGEVALKQYQPFVGELTMPLHVVGEDGETVIFSVPPLAPRPRPTMASGDALTAENILKAMGRQYDLGNVNTDQQVADYMLKITGFANYREVVIEPLKTILARYDKVLMLPNGEPLEGEETPKEETPSTAPSSSSSFTDEYED